MQADCDECMGRRISGAQARTSMWTFMLLKCNSACGLTISSRRHRVHDLLRLLRHAPLYAIKIYSTSLTCTHFHLFYTAAQHSAHVAHGLLHHVSMTTHLLVAPSGPTTPLPQQHRTLLMLYALCFAVPS
eukprot:1160914-Pelagomonas_calceolata.AAC.2